MKIPIFHVDAFTPVPFKGNPAGVCLLEEEMPDRWMQSLAAEMNLSETAYIVAHGSRLQLRWFAPKMEVPLCGHATLATAHVLFEEGRFSAESIIRFETLSGTLAATKKGGWIELDFPERERMPIQPPASLLEALRSTFRFVGKTDDDLFVELDSEEAVRALQPDMNLIEALPVRGVMVTAASSDANYDYVARFFAPRVGVAEDPVTGSMHCTLAPWWAERKGKRELKVYQASERGGELRVRVGEGRVYLQGQAVTISRGTLEV